MLRRSALLSSARIADSLRRAKLAMRAKRGFRRHIDATQGQPTSIHYIDTAARTNTAGATGPQLRRSGRQTSARPLLDA